MTVTLSITAIVLVRRDETIVVMLSVTVIDSAAAAEAVHEVIYSSWHNIWSPVCV